MSSEHAVNPLWLNNFATALGELSRLLLRELSASHQGLL